jgi:hypothetical protein
MHSQTPTRDGREVARGALAAKHVGRQLRIDPIDFGYYLREKGQG